MPINMEETKQFLHDIKTPVTVLRMLHQILSEETETNREETDNLKMMDEELTKMQQLLESFSNKVKSESWLNPF